MSDVYESEAFHSNNKLTVINLFGAPGIGKSALKGGLFELMKLKHESVEAIDEVAKHLVHANRTWQLREDQLYLLAMQHHKQFVLRGLYKYCITDSPLLLTAYYAAKDVTPYEFFPCVEAYHRTYDNLNFFVDRDLSKDNAVFDEIGRCHNKDDSIRIANEQRDFLDRLNIPYVDIVLSEDGMAKHEIYNYIKSLK